VETLRTLNLLNNTLIIFTSDHGDGFAKYHKYDRSHAYFLYNTVIKAPLIFYSQNLPRRGVIVDDYVTSMDILPTTLDMMNIQYDQRGFDGISHLDIFDRTVSPEKKERLIVSETNFKNKKRGMRRSCIIWKQRWKLIHNYQRLTKKRRLPVYELYDLKNDLNEVNNLFEKKKALAKNLISLLQEWQKENTGILSEDAVSLEESMDKIPPETLEQLKALGYIK
jgi:arylsulfatase A-like enzyme